MTIGLLASQCAAPVGETNYPLLAAAENTNGTGVAVARAFAAGETATVPASLNRNGDALDLLASFGGGGFAVITGLTLSDGGGLTLNVAAGLAALGGYVEIEATSVGLADAHNTATDRNWIWLSQNGAVTKTLTTTPPNAHAICIGSVTTSGGAITGIDTSGVVYLKGGALFRETADLGPPGDSPSALLTLFTRTPGGVFFWDTTAHRPLYEPLSANKMTIASTEAMKIEALEQVVLNTSLTPLTLDGTLTIDGELHL